MWGRGAIDMKHMAAMVVCRLKQEKRTLTRDIIFTAVADEEAGCDEGSKFLVDKHPDRVRAEYAIGEAGGFTVNVNGQAISPLYDAIVETVHKHHPGSICVPTLMPGFTDAKQWSRLGARCYGFCPVRFPDSGPRFGDLFHGHDERVPVEGIKWGVKVLYDLVVRFAG